MNYRIAEEAQLLAEEKWIIDALNKIKNQRNCLQIERLHLKSLKAKYNQQVHQGKECSTKTTTDESDTLSTCALSTVSKQSIFQGSTFSNFDFGVPLMDTIDSCNTEELNLAVTKSIYSQDHEMNNIEEYDEEEEEEDDVVIDMNMFMNGKLESS